MTDDDTTDGSDRMERANRIREMREGRRRSNGDDSEPEEELTVETVGDETASANAAALEETPAETDDPADGSEAADDAAEPAAVDDADAHDGAEAADAGADDADAADGSEAADDAADPNAGGFEFDAEESSADDATGATEAGAEAAAAAADSGAAEADTEPADAGEPDAGDAPAAAPTDATRAADVARPQSGVANSVSAADATAAVDDLSAPGTFRIPEQATNVTEDDAASALDGAEGHVGGARAGASGGIHAGESTRVLEFELGDERFCLDIEYVEEIVELENVTRVPNSPSYVEGVVDLRGQVTAIINPKDALNVDNDRSGDLIVVFDSEQLDEQGHLGWLVDEVRQVTAVADEEVNDAPDEDDEYINGIINREDEDDFVVWTIPELALNPS
ncbi:MAG: chemotaxis protein CheW [Haloarculaceae archaeon]